MTAIIDTHVHLYPEEVSHDPAGWAAAHDEPYWGMLVTPAPGRRSVQGWATVERLLADMDRAGVERAILLGWYWEQQTTCEWQNRFYEQCIREHPDRLSAFGTMQPLAGDAALDEIRRLADRGFIGLGELCPFASGSNPDNPGWQKAFALAEELQLPVNLHVSEPVGSRYPGKLATPFEALESIFEKYPSLTFILAHWGGGLALYELNRGFRKRAGNVFYDTAASPLIYDTAIFPVLTRAAGADKILFGSDYPLGLYPRLGSDPDMSRFVEQVRTSGMEPEVRDAILGENARRLFFPNNG